MQLTDLKVWSLFYYLTEIDGITWRGQDYDTRAMVKLMKGLPFKGYFNLKTGAANVTYTEESGDKFRMPLAATLGHKLKVELSSKISIVPIPSSDMAIGSGTDYTIVKMAEGIARSYGPNAEMCPALCWKAPKPKAHLNGGFRHPDQFEPLLHLAYRPNNPVVLFDDVLTSGSQMTAAARFLAKHGHTPVLGIVGARVTRVQQPAMFGWSNLDLEVSPRSVDMGLFGL